MKTGWIFTAAAVAAAALAGCREKGGREPGPAPGDGVAQVAIPRIEKMDNMPVPYKIIDWKRKALEFDNYAFDFDSSMPAGRLSGSTMHSVTCRSRPSGSTLPYTMYVRVPRRTAESSTKASLRWRPYSEAV